MTLLRVLVWARVALLITQALRDQEALAEEFPHAEVAETSLSERGSAEEQGQFLTAEHTTGTASQKALSVLSRHAARRTKRSKRGVRKALCKKVSFFVKSIKENITCVKTVRDAVGNPALAGTLVDYGLTVNGGNSMVVAFLKDVPGFAPAQIGKTIWMMVWNGAKLSERIFCNATMSACKEGHAWIKVGIGFMAIATMFNALTLPLTASVSIAVTSWLMSHGLTDLCDFMEHRFKEEGWAGVWKHSVAMFWNATARVKESVRALIDLRKKSLREMVSLVKQIVSEFFQMMFSCAKNLYGFLKNFAKSSAKKAVTAARVLKAKASTGATKLKAAVGTAAQKAKWIGKFKFLKKEKKNTETKGA
mmetsp:Transcript_42382/g.122618  ORF Transcript_42382/g.122618 Transcript_42382/m.122618 type:complete len:363 (+) Transcript_42382:82-1170(+)